MRDRQADLCPACGSKFKIVVNSERRVRTGVWCEYRCPNCGRRVNEFISNAKLRNRT